MDIHALLAGLHANRFGAASMILFVIIIIGSIFIKWVLSDHDAKPAKVKKGV